LQGVDIWSPASTDNSGRRSFPALELLDVDVEGGRRSLPTPKPRDEDDKRQSFITTNLQDMAAEVQSTSASDLPEHRSFPALEMSDGDIEDGRCSFPTPKSYHTNTSRRHQLYVAVEA
jgi:hypothetical protein